MFVFTYHMNAEPAARCGGSDRCDNCSNGHVGGWTYDPKREKNYGGLAEWLGSLKFQQSPV